jgi:hypothetical protein
VQDACSTIEQLLLTSQLHDPFEQTRFRVTSCGWQSQSVQFPPQESIDDELLSGAIVGKVVRGIAAAGRAAAGKAAAGKASAGKASAGRAAAGKAAAGKASVGRAAAGKAAAVSATLCSIAQGAVIVDIYSQELNTGGLGEKFPRISVLIFVIVEVNLLYNVENILIYIYAVHFKFRNRQLVPLS